MTFWTNGKTIIAKIGIMSKNFKSKQSLQIQLEQRFKDMLKLTKINTYYGVTFQS